MIYAFQSNIIYQNRNISEELFYWNKEKREGMFRRKIMYANTEELLTLNEDFSSIFQLFFYRWSKRN